MPALITNPPVFVPLPATYPTLYDTLNIESGNQNTFGPFVAGATLYLVASNGTAGLLTVSDESGHGTEYINISTAAVTIHIPDDTGTPNLALTVSVVGITITVQLATDGFGNITTTNNALLAAMAASAPASALVTGALIPGSVGNEVVQPTTGTISGSFGLTVFASTDSGATWTAQDTVHKPASGTISVVQSGTTLHVAIVFGGGHVYLITFNCLTSLWGTLSIDAGVTAAIGTAITVQANGTRFVFYTQAGEGNAINLLRLTSGGVWSGPTTIATAGVGTFNRLTGALLDGAAVSHVFWEQRSSGGITNCKLQTIGVDNTGALVGVVADISASTATITTLQTDTAAIPAANLSLGANGTYAQPVPWQAGLAGVVTNPLPEVVLGNPTDGWATSSPDPTGLSLPVAPLSAAACFQCLSTGSSVYAFWFVYDQGTGGTLVGQMWYGVWNGATWGAPKFAYDYIANPPGAPADIPAQLVAGSANAAILPSGALAMAIAFQVSANPPATHGTAFPVYFALGPASVAVEPNPPTAQSGGGPPKLTRAKPGPVVDLHPVKSKCPECTCDDVLDLVLMQSDVLGLS